MKDKIREFERRSGLDVYSLGRSRDEWVLKLEQFSSSIVEECVRELSAQLQCDPYTGELYNTEVNQVLLESIKNIKEIV